MVDPRPEARRAVTVVGRRPDGPAQIYVDKDMSRLTTVAEFREQLRQAGVNGKLAATIIDSMRGVLADGNQRIGHA